MKTLADPPRRSGVPLRWPHIPVAALRKSFLQPMAQGPAARFAAGRCPFLRGAREG